MANEQVKIAGEIKVNRGWFNFMDDKGRNIGIMDSVEKNPKLKAIMDLAKVGDVIEMNIASKEGADGKMAHYGWDPKPAFGGGGAKKPFTPLDKSFQAAMSAMQATAVLYANKPVEELAKLPATFEKLHALIMSKAAAPAAEAPKA